MKKISIALILVMAVNLCMLTAFADVYYSYDFEGFDGSDNGLSAPSGWTLMNSAAGSSCVYSVLTEKGTSVMMYSTDPTKVLQMRHTGAALTSAFSAETRILMKDYSVARTIALREGGSSVHHVVRFEKDRTVTVFGTKLENYQYSKDTWYRVKLTYNPANENYAVYIDDGKSVVSSSGTGNISVKQLTYLYINYHSGNDGTAVSYIDDFKLYGDPDFETSDMRIEYISPFDGEENVSVSGDIDIITNHEIDTSAVTEGTFSLNGVPVDLSCISYPGANSIKIKPDGLLEPGTAYTFTVSDLTDTNGNSKSFTLNFTTGPLRYYSPVRVTETDENTVAASVETRAYDITDGGSDSVSLIMAAYGKDKSMTDITFENIPVTDTLSTGNAELAITGGTLGCALWDSIYGMKTVTARQSDYNVPEEYYSKSIDWDNGIITVKAFAPQGDTVNITVLNPGAVPDDLKAVTKDNIKDYVNYLDTKQASEEGECTFEFSPGNVMGSFGIMLNFNNGEAFKYVPDAFEYYSQSYVDSVLEALSSENADYTQLLDTYGKFLGIDRSEFFGLPDDIYRDKICADLKASAPYTSVEAFKNVYLKSLCVSRINAAKSAAEVKECIDANADIFSLDKLAVYKTFSHLTDSVKDSMYAKIAEKNDYSQISDICGRFTEQSILYGIANASNQSEVGIILKENIEFLELDMTKYNALTNQSAVNTALGGNLYSDINALKEAFIEKTAEQYKKENSSKVTPSGGSGGGGGGGGRTSISPVTDYNVYENTDEPQTQPQKETFNDLKNVPWAHEAIEYLAENDVINGDGNGNFLPDNNITREEFVKMIVLAFNIAESADSISFNDVPEDDYFRPFISAAVSQNIVKGKPESDFGIGDIITRQDMAVIVYRTMALGGKSMDCGEYTEFGDSEYISDYAKDSVYYLVSKGILNGTGENMFSPLGAATRAQAAKMIYGALMMGGK